MVPPCVVPKHVAWGGSPGEGWASCEAGWAAETASRLHALFSCWVISYCGQNPGVEGWGGLHAWVGLMKAFSIFASFMTLLCHFSNARQKFSLPAAFPSMGENDTVSLRSFACINTCRNTVVSGHALCRSPWPELAEIYLWARRLLGVVEGLAGTRNHVNIIFLETR